MTWFEVAYAEPDRQIVLHVEGEPGLNVRQIIERSGLLRAIPEIDLEAQAVGIFGRIVTLEHCPEEGERVEIYRALLADPRAKRRERAARQREAKRR